MPHIIDVPFVCPTRRLHCNGYTAPCVLGAPAPWWRWDSLHPDTTATGSDSGKQNSKLFKEEKCIILVVRFNEKYSLKIDQRLNHIQYMDKKHLGTH